MEFTYGEKQKAVDFVKRITDEDKVAIVSHIDLDGIASAKVINKIVNPEVVKLINHDELASIEFREELKSKSINKIILIDLSISDKNTIFDFERFADVLMIDHHQYDFDFNSKKTVFIQSFGYCAAYIAYDLFVSDFDSLKKIKWLVALASLDDFMFKKNNSWLESVFKQYGYIYDFQNPQSGEFWDNVLMFDKAIIYFRGDLIKLYEHIRDDISELEDMEEYSNMVDIDLADNERRYKSDREEVFDGFIFEIDSKYKIESLLSTLISIKNEDKNIFLVLKGDKYYKISVRRQDGKYNMGLFLKNVTSDFKDKSAGGHSKAAGASVLHSDYEEFKERVKDENRYTEFLVS